VNCPIYQADASTHRFFGGRRAAVVVLDEWLDDQSLQAIAAENNVAETAFVIPGSPLPTVPWVFYNKRGKRVQRRLECQVLRFALYG